EDRAAGRQAFEGKRVHDSGRIVDAQEIVVFQLAVHVDVRVADGQVIGRRQALLFGAVLRIGLHVLAEDIAGDGGDDLVGGDAAEAADRVAAHRETALGPQVGVFRFFQSQGVIDAHAEEVLAVRVHHVVDGGDNIAGPHVAAA